MRPIFSGVDFEWYIMENIQKQIVDELVSEEFSSEIASRTNGLMGIANLFRFPAQNSLDLLIKQLGTGKQTKKPTFQKIIVSDSRPAPIRGLNRDQAAMYIGISASKFDELLKDGRMPPPKKIDGRVVWDVRHRDKYFDRLPGGDVDDQNPWEVVP